ncbi:MAG TPA: sigma-70 family RNA polymerase sigma factor [Solirubrobacteraceae bacterium]|nr:sigma-70 family RNA polymerase sigma factor [Solirubrobacteraceae bacterium]
MDTPGATATNTTAVRSYGVTATAADAALMARVAGGDSAAFDELYRRHGHRALLLARKLCSGREQAEEVAQEAFISLWRGAHAYKPASGSVSTWLSSMVRNRAIDAWRRASVRPVEVELSGTGAAEPVAPVTTQPAAPERALALALIADLPAAQKEAVFLAYFGDMTHSEIATHVGAPLGTVKGRIRLGVERLRDSFEERDTNGAGGVRPLTHHPLSGHALLERDGQRCTAG